MHKSIYRLKECPTCSKDQKLVDWMSWCSKCGMTVCSNCVSSHHQCRDGVEFGIPGRGTRYFSTMTLHEGTPQKGA